jgi:hypothetical protein
VSTPRRRATSFQTSTLKPDTGVPGSFTNGEENPVATRSSGRTLTAGAGSAPANPAQLRPSSAGTVRRIRCHGAGPDTAEAAGRCGQALRPPVPGGRPVTPSFIAWDLVGR